MFVDDVIATVSNSVDRMQRLMEQMRTGIRGSSRHAVSLSELLHACIHGLSESLPHPAAEGDWPECIIETDREQLATVFSHLIQNAQEATDKSGYVKVSLQHADDQAHITISDSGCGMDQDFIQHRLFKPFDSTKGLTGMGIGAFESREFVRSLGGDITVESTTGVGSVFSVVIPCESSVPA